MSSKLSCRNCGDEVTDFETAKKKVKKEYNYTDEELETTKTIRVWHCQCALADKRINKLKECGGPFYWEVV